MKNPQAFPSDENTQTKKGMTLLDYFAGQALNGVLSNSKVESMRIAEFDDKYTDEQQTEAVVLFCYKTAEAMLKEREKQCII